MLQRLAPLKAPGEALQPALAQSSHERPVNLGSETVLGRQQHSTRKERLDEKSVGEAKQIFASRFSIGYTLSPFW